MIPEKIGRYEIEKELGRGGMAVVYLATDPFMSREVALKVLPRQFTFDPQFRARFQREAQVIAKLDHPGIVPVYDFGEHEEQPFIVMRYMKGGSLADQLKDHGPFPVEKTAGILKRIGSALDEAHQKGIVHRDLKPGNILFDDRGDAFVADFGIVKMSEATIQYTGNAIIGTPGYMSPEQARGDEEVDGRSDIYSLGAIAYEMLTGRLPYQSDTPMGLVMKHILEPVPDLMAVRPDLPITTGTVISTAMAKEPNLRFQSCTDIANALSDSATVQFSAGNLPLGSSETVLESPSSTDYAGTVVESPSLPKQQTYPPTAIDSPTGGLRTGGISGTTTGPDPVQAYTAEPKKKGGIPTWGIAAGCIVLLCIGGVIAASAFGVLGNFLGNPTPTLVAVVADTATPEPNGDATATAEPTLAPTATSEAAEPTSTSDFNLIPDTPTPEVSGPVGGGPITIGSSENGFVSSGQSQEWTFTASAGDRIDVQVIPEGEELDLVFNVLDPSRESIVPGGEVDNNSFGTEQVLNLTLSRDGTYIIAVTGFGGASGAYVLTTAVAQAAPPGSTLSASDTLSAGSEHLFPFHANGPGTVTAIVEPEGDTDLILGIYNDDDDSLLEQVDETFTRETLSYDIPAAGNYYFRITGFDETVSGGYDITITTPPDVILLLASRDEIVGSFGTDSELEYFFRGEAGEIFTVSITTNDPIDTVIEIYDDNEVQLADVDDNLSGVGETLTFTLPADGLYTIRIREFFGETGGFFMTIE